MLEFQKYKIIVVMMVFVLLMNACGGSSQVQSEIATAVAQTVQAQDSLTQVASLPTSTPIPSTPPIDTITTPDVVLPTSTFAPASNPGCILSADLIQEDPPDGAIYKPGETFYKRWWLQNTGTCTWDSTYKLIFWDGDLMGGAVSYPLPEVVAPNETREIPILLQAPGTTGDVTGYWRLRSPWGIDFGVGQADQSFYVQIVVSDSTKVKFGVTSVSYNIERDPLAGCPTNVSYNASAVISTNGPATVQYYWRYSDGGKTDKETLNFKDAGSKTVNTTWKLLAKANSGVRSLWIVVLAPEFQEWKEVTFTHNCE